MVEERVLRLWSPAALLWMFLLTIAVRAPGVELPQLAERTMKSVVHLAIFDGGQEIGGGTGFFVDRRRVATNHHVIEGATEVRARLSDGRELPVAGWLAVDAERDIAIIEVIGDDVPPALELGSSGDLQQGTEIVVIGSPAGLSGTLSTGIVSALRGGGLTEESFTRAWTIQISAAVSAGSSGSPIMTRDGKVVAVAVGIHRDGQNLGFGVPVEAVKDALAGIGSDAVAKSFLVREGERSVVLRNLLISAVFFGALILAFFVPGWIRRWRGRRRAR